MVTELKIEELSVEQKIGQLIVARKCMSEEDREIVLEMIKKRAVGGVQTGFESDYKEFMDEVKRTADYPLLICADMETGYPGGEYKIPFPIGIASSGVPHNAYDLGRVVAIEAKKDGANCIWGPVADIAAEGALFKIARCFSDDPEIVSEYVVEMIKGLQSEGMVATLKHFPGGSDILCDTHLMTEASSFTEKELLEKDIIPYIRAMKEADLSGIMTSHVLLSKIDDKYIASLSKKVIDVIRKQGFDGLIVTDSLAMMAIANNYGDEAALGLAISAGNDMVLPNFRVGYKKTYEYLMNAYKQGIITEERLNEAVRHVLEAQKKTMKKPSHNEIPDDLKKTAEDANKNSIIAILKDGYDVKLSDDSKKLFVLLCENSYPGIDGTSPEFDSKAYFLKNKVETIKESLLKNFPGSDAMIISEFPHQHEMSTVCAEAIKYDEVVFYIFCRASCYLGSDGITERVKNLIYANANKTAAIVHIGNPYVLKNFKNIKRIITAPYGSNTEEWIIKALKGEFEPTGKLPVSL